MKISNRLKVISNYVLDNSKVLDVGCDHALLDIYLVLNKKNVEAIASDINSGPLKSAYDNIKKYHLEDKIKIKQGNGIETITKDIDTVIIAGMGGKTICGILKYSNKLDNVETLILSPHNDFSFVRECVTKLGFYIDKEELLLDNKIYYLIMRFKRGKRHYNKKELFFGPLLLTNKDELFINYYKQELMRKELLLKALPNNYFLKRIITKREIKTIKNILKEDI